MSECLESIEILVDSREHNTAQARKRYRAFGVPFKRCILDYGDYAINCKLPNGDHIYDTSERVSADVVVERKMNLDELAMCFGKQRARFQREFERAAKNKAKVYLLVENGSWEGILLGRYRSRMNPIAFLASLTAWMARYNISVIFCKPDTSGELIKEILYRELKENLTNKEDADGKNKDA